MRHALALIAACVLAPAAALAAAWQVERHADWGFEAAPPAPLAFASEEKGEDSGHPIVTRAWAAGHEGTVFIVTSTDMKAVVPARTLDRDVVAENVMRGASTAPGVRLISRRPGAYPGPGQRDFVIEQDGMRLRMRGTVEYPWTIAGMVAAPAGALDALESPDAERFLASVRIAR